jgi:hypothetical protein
MTVDEIIREGRELCEKATPGPWEYESGDTWDASGVSGPMKRTNRGRETPIVCNTSYDVDGNFIARARTLLPAALDALEEATKRNKQLEGVIEKGVKAMDAASELIGVTAAGVKHGLETNRR